MRQSMTLFGSLFALALVAAGALHFTGTTGSTASAAAATSQSAKSYTIDPVHTSVIFGIRHLDVATFYGRFNDISGTIAWNEDSPSNSAIEIEIKAESVDTNNQGRDDHLRNPDFFNAREFPTITFKSTKIETRDETYRVTGDLKLHGVERSITVDLKKTGSATHPRTGKHIIGLESHFTIKRSNHRMNYGIEQNMLGDEVKLIIAIEAIED